MATDVTKRVLLCADDFGLHTEVDAAILELAASGRLGATSCLVDGPGFELGAARLNQTALQVGLHLNFTESFPRGGTVAHPLHHLLMIAWLRRLSLAEIRAEIARQLDRFAAVMGRLPDYVDGHQHVHQFPVIRDALFLEIAARCLETGWRPWLRSTVAGTFGDLPPGTRLKSLIIERLGAAAFRHRAQHHGHRVNQRLLGVYDFQGGREGYLALTRHWLAVAGDGDLIMCHPAKASVPGDALGKQRVAEFDILASALLDAELAQNGIHLTSDFFRSDATSG